MTTRAANIQFLLSGLTNPTTGEPVENGTVYFYESGTTTEKYVWTEIEKTNGYYSYDLDAVGAANLFGEGSYKIVIKASDGSTVATLDPVRLEHPYYGIRTVTAGTVTMVTQDDLILCNTTSGTITIDALAAASWTRPLKIKRISGSNNITIDPNGSELIDGSSTLTISSDGIIEIVSDGSNLLSVGFRSSVADSDNDTIHYVEKNSDEDIHRFDAGGTEDVLKIYSSGPYNVYVSGGLSITSGNISQSSGSVFSGGTIYPTTLKVNEDVAVTATSTDINNANYILVDSDETGDTLSSVTFTGLVEAKKYILEYEMLWISGASNSIALRFGNSGGVDTGNNYSYCVNWMDYLGNSVYASAGHNYAYTQRGQTFDGGVFCVGTVEFSTKLGDATIVSGLTRVSNRDTNDYCNGTIQYNGASDVDRVQILVDGGSFNGRMRLYKTN